MESNKEDSIKQWLAKANDDKDVIEALLNLDYELHSYDNVCYHCQQCAEKYLKAYMIFLDISFPFIHDLTELWKSIMVKDSDAEVIKETCVVLSAYSTTTRYPDDYDADIHEAREAFQKAQEIVDYINTRIRIKLAP